MERTKRHQVNAAAVFLVLTLFVAGQTLAGNGDSTAAIGSASLYKPFSEAEINTAVQNPLTLDDCIRIALSKNISLRIAQGELARAEATHAGSYSAYFPVFTLLGTKENTLEKRPVDSISVASLAEQNFDTRALVATVQQTLPTGAVLDFSGDIRRDLNSPDKFEAPPTRTRNRIYSVQLRQPLLRNAWPNAARSAITAARYDREIQEKQFLNAKFQTIFAIKNAFYEVLYQRELIRVNQAAIQRDSTLFAASESKVAAKLATRRDVLSAEIQLASDKASLIKSQSDYEFALDALKEVMGLPIEMPIEVVGVKLSDEPVSLQQERLLRQALENNPSLHGAEAGIDRSRLQLKVARNQLLPQFDLIAGYSGSFEKEDTEQGIDLRTTGFITTVSLSYSFLDRAAAASAENAQIALSQQQDNVLNLKRQLALSVRSIVRNTYSSIEAINTLRRTIEAAEQKVDFATTMFNLGRASNLDITDAQEALLKAQTQYVRELVDYHIQLALLESLTGQPVTPVR
ncbi:TolC family protein [candidate division KSB1 bacterium]|nr:TolC family protein [candidate division KSB1 bacterium]